MRAVLIYTTAEGQNMGDNAINNHVEKNMSQTIISIQGLDKTYSNGFSALKDVSLEVAEGEILALLGPNGAGKTTLIGSICGLVSPSSGVVEVGGFDIHKNARKARSMIGLVPQEIALEIFSTVWDTVRFSRGLFGCKADDAYIETLLKSLSLWDKKDNTIVSLSGGMKRRVMIAKALSHQPKVLFLDEPTAGVDVALRKDMWEVVDKLRKTGVTIILTTHYIEEAEEMADRIAVIRKGEILLVEEKEALLQRFGQKQVHLHLTAELTQMPSALEESDLELSADKKTITYTYDVMSKRTGITSLIAELAKNNVHIRDIDTRKSSLEEVFLSLVEEQKS